jgi:hypothetical protein
MDHTIIIFLTGRFSNQLPLPPVNRVTPQLIHLI